MKKYYLLFTFLFSISFSINAQTEVTLKGIVLDSLKSPLVGASVMLMHEKDSLLEHFSITKSTGAFELLAQEADAYLLQITYVGYGTFVRKLNIKQGDDDINFGEIVLRTDAFHLEGVEITESFIPIVIKKDTIEYNAAAFKTKPNAVVEDLLKKLPGVEVDKDGTIRAQGQEVQNVLVDGKEFFDNDPKIATRNIPADIVNKVQVFDQASDFAAFTGIDDGQDEKTINLQIKAGKNKGVFGSLKAAYGTDKRYTTSANVNRFTDKMQLSFLGNGNNINEQAFTLMDYFDFMGGLGEMMGGEGIDFSQIPSNLLEHAGMTKNFSSGINFNYDFNKKTSLRSNYFGNFSDNFTDTKANFLNVLKDGTYTNKSQSLANSKLFSQRGKLKLKHIFDQSQDLSLTLRLTHSDNTNTLFSESQAVVQDDFISNESQIENNSVLDKFYWKGDLMYRKKLKKAGRFFTAKGTLSNQNNNNNLWINNELTFFYPNDSTGLKTRNIQKQEDLNKGIQYKGALNYVEPLGKGKYLNFSLIRENENKDRSKIFKDEFDLLDESLTGNLERQFTRNRAGLAFKIVRSASNFSVGLDYQLIDLENEDSRTGPFSKPFKNFLPNVAFDYQFNKTTRLNLAYSTSIQIPLVEQMQTVLRNEDPLNIYVGNPDLTAEYIHSANFNYSNFNQFHFRSFFSGFQLQIKTNSIIEKTTISPDLVRNTTSVNGAKEWSLNSYFNYDSPVKGKNLKVSTNGEIRWMNTNLLINDFLDRNSLFIWNQTFKIENKKKKKIDLGLAYTFGSNLTNYQFNPSQNEHFIKHSLSSDFIWYLKKTWTFELNYEYQLYPQTNFGNTDQFNFIHSTLTKTCLDNQLSFYLKGLNLLDEQYTIERNSFGNQYSEMIKNRLGRTILLGVSYKIRSFGK